MAGARMLRFLTVVVVVVSVGLAVGTSSLLGSSQGGKTVTVGPSGCDFKTIQAAIDAVPDGSTVQVTAGTYKENLTIRNRNGLILQGAGPDKVTLDGNGPQQKDITPGILILSSRNTTVTGFRITNCRRGVEADDSTLVFIDGNVLEQNLRNSIYLLRSQGEVTGNTVQNTLVDVTGSNGEGVAIEESRAKLTGNTITGNAGEGIRAGLLDVNSQSEVTGSGNVVRDNKGGNLSGNAPMTLLADPAAEGTLDQVAVPGDVPTIQEAIDKVKAGGTVTVAVGTYKGKVEIYKSVTIRGAGAANTVLQAPGADCLTLNIATDQLQVTIEGLRVTGGRYGVRAATGPAGALTLRDMKIDGNGAGKPDDGGLWVCGQVTATLDQVTSSGNAGCGAYVLGTAKVTARRCTVADNSSYGLGIGYGASATIEESTISRNGSYGIAVSNTGVVELKDCTVAANGTIGVSASGSGQVTIADTRITGTKPDSAGEYGYGISARGQSRVTLQKCTVSDNMGYGVRIRDSSQATLSDTRVTDTRANPAGKLGFGVAVQNESSATIQECTVQGNSLSGVIVTGNSKVAIEGGTVSGNVSGGIELYDTCEATITGTRVAETKAGADGSWGVGVCAFEASKATIRACTISGNAEAGVWIGDSATVSVAESTLSSNLNSGVECSGTAHATIQGNTISGNAACGIVASESAEVVISGNRITGTKKYTNGNLGRGLWAYAQSKTTIRDNTITGSAEDGIRFGDGGTANETATTEISGNTIRGNANCGVRMDSDVGLKVAGQGNTIADNKNGNLCGTATKCPRGFGGGK